ncbi:hypothetical protein [Tissierella sp.]|uniref:hypothetical protein n=1 Tax=Tissierella sp. TaxID=41274 RepID=UPI00302D64DE
MNCRGGEIMAEVYVDANGLEYTKSNRRLRYTPEIHYRHGEKWTKEEMIELCGLWESMKKRDIALGLGRTESVCLSKIYYLRKIGLFEYYKNEFKKSLM